MSLYSIEKVNLTTRYDKKFSTAAVIIICKAGGLMNTVIYADILVAVNMIVNYLLLRASCAVTGADCRTVRLFLSAAAGGLYSMIIFVNGIPPFVSFLIKLVFLLFMVAVAFGAKSLKSFAKNCAAFFIANFVFAGVMLAISTFVSPHGALYVNGVAYFDINIITLVAVSVICYIILSVLSRLARNRAPAQSIYEITVEYAGNKITGTALYDTGNSLRDSFSGRPVIIADKSFAEKIIGNGGDVTEQKNFRLIPYNTIKNGGALPAFMAESVTVSASGGDVCVRNVYVAVPEQKLISGGFCALLGTPVFDAADNDIKGSVSAVRR